MCEQIRLKKENIVNYFTENPKAIFLILLLFVTGGVFGFIVEVIFYRINSGYFINRGITFGPWIPIYGFGAIFIIPLTDRLKKRPWVVFALGSVIAVVLELVTGYVLHRVFNIRLWNYNEEIWNWLNIGGYVCLRSVVAFGAAVILFQYVVYPICRSFVDKMSKKALILIVGIPAALFWLDIIASIIYGAVR